MSPSKYPQYQWLFKANSESIVSSVQQWLPRFPRRWEAGAKPNPFCSVQKRINGILYIYCIYTCTVCIVYIYIYVYVTLNSFTLQWVSMVLSHVWIVELCSSAASLLNRQCSCTGTEWPSFRVPVTRSKALGVKFHQAFFFPSKVMRWLWTFFRRHQIFYRFSGKKSTWHFTVTMNGWFCQAILKHPKELRTSQAVPVFLWWKWRVWSFRVSDPRGPGLPESPGAAVCRICWTRMSSDRTVMRLLGSCGITPQQRGFISGKSWDNLKKTVMWMIIWINILWIFMDNII